MQFAGGADGILDYGTILLPTRAGCAPLGGIREDSIFDCIT